jgi:hypothetical protein
MRAHWSSGAIILALAAGCGGDPAGMADAGGEGGSGGSTPADAGIEDARGGADTAVAAGDAGSALAFIGSWVYQSGQEEVACVGKAAESHDLTGVTLVLARGTSAPLVVNGDTCRLEFDVSGNVASVRPNQVCKDVEGASTLTYTVKSYTLTLGDMMLVEMSAWMIDFMDPGGDLQCAYTTSGRLQRAP